jgi:hypothetical protein
MGVVGARGHSANWQARGMRRLFLRVRRCRWKKCQIVTMPACTPALASPALISARVMSGF